MHCIPSRQLVIAAFLALQAIATPCMPCACRQGNEQGVLGEDPLTSSGNLLDGVKTSCPACGATAKVQRPYRPSLRDHQLRVLGITTERPLLRDGDTVPHAAIAPHSRHVPTLALHESRVLRV